MFTHVLQSLLLLFQLGVDLHEGLLRLVEVVLNGLDLLLELSRFLFGLQLQQTNENILQTRVFLVSLPTYVIEQHKFNLRKLSFPQLNKERSTQWLSNFISLFLSFSLYNSLLKDKERSNTWLLVQFLMVLSLQMDLRKYSNKRRWVYNPIVTYILTPH